MNYTLNAISVVSEEACLDEGFFLYDWVYVLKYVLFENILKNLND